MPLNANGYTQRTYDQILDELKRFLLIRLPEFTNQPADIQNNILNTSIASLMQYEQLMSSVFNSFNLAFSNKDLYLKQAEELGLRQKEEFQAQVVLTFKGEKGQYIPANIVVSDEAQTVKFTTQEAFTIPSTKEKSVIAKADTEEVYAANTLTKIITTLPDTVTVTNNNDSLVKIPAETFEQLRARAQAKLRAARMGGRIYAEQLLKGVDGVDPRLVAFYALEYDVEAEKDDGSLITKEIKGIHAVVGGGDDYEVAGALYQAFFETQKIRSEPSFDEANRTVNVDLSIYNAIIPVTFTRPKLYKLWIKMSLSLLSAGLASKETVKSGTQNELTEYINSLTVGTKVNQYALMSISMPALEKNAQLKPYTYKDLKFQYAIDPDDGTEPSGQTAWQDFNQDGFIDIIRDDCYCILTGLYVGFNE